MAAEDLNGISEYYYNLEITNRQTAQIALEFLKKAATNRRWMASHIEWLTTMAELISRECPEIDPSEGI